MKTKDQVKIEFLTDLNNLLLKYDAEITAEDHWQGYPECGEDIQIGIDIPGVFDEERNCVAEYCSFTLGRYIIGSPVEE